jgi:hypothetical protein
MRIAKLNVSVLSVLFTGAIAVLAMLGSTSTASAAIGHGCAQKSRVVYHCNEPPPIVHVKVRHVAKVSVPRRPHRHYAGPAITNVYCKDGKWVTRNGRPYVPHYAFMF